MAGDEWEFKKYILIPNGQNAQISLAGDEWKKNIKIPNGQNAQISLAGVEWKYKKKHLNPKWPKSLQRRSHNRVHMHLSQRQRLQVVWDLITAWYSQQHLSLDRRGGVPEIPTLAFTGN